MMLSPAGRLSGTLLIVFLTAFAVPSLAGEPETQSTQVVAHRGLLRHAPENTLSNFRACLELRLGFEFDVRRSEDGKLVCVHDVTVNRTTDARGPVADYTLQELKTLDAGSWFAPEFAEERIPTIDEILALVADSPEVSTPIAVDVKAGDPEVASELVQLARKHDVLGRLLFIGRTIGEADFRRQLHKADSNVHAACLANAPKELDAAIQDKFSDWVYLRYLPTPQEVEQIRAANKRMFLAGPTVGSRQPENWGQARHLGIDVILTDYPLELKRLLRAKREK